MLQMQDSLKRSRASALLFIFTTFLPPFRPPSRLSDTREWGPLRSTTMKVNVKTERAGLCPAPTKVIRITLDSAFLLGNYPQTPATFKRQVERLKLYPQPLSRGAKTRTPAPPGDKTKEKLGGTLSTCLWSNKCAT